MEELLQKLLDTEVLSEDVKKEVEDAFKTQLDEAITAAKEEAKADVRAELTEQWITERDQLVEAVDAKVGEFLKTELAELKNDIESFRDLEAEYAEKLVESKAAMSEELKKDLSELVEKVNAFLEMRLNSELEEFREDLQLVRQNEFGRRIYAAIEEEFAANFADGDSAEATLRETQKRVTDLEEALEESEGKRMKVERTVKMEEVLSPLSGKQREVMEAILRNVDTERLEEGYTTFIGRVISESEEETAGSEKEDKVLAESEKTSEDGDKDVLEEGVVVTGDTEEVIEEGQDEQKKSLSRLQALAGIKK